MPAGDARRVNVRSAIIATFGQLRNGRDMAGPGAAIRRRHRIALANIVPGLSVSDLLRIAGERGPSHLRDIYTVIRQVGAMARANPRQRLPDDDL